MTITSSTSLFVSSSFECENFGWETSPVCRKGVHPRLPINWSKAPISDNLAEREHASQASQRNCKFELSVNQDKLHFLVVVSLFLVSLSSASAEYGINAPRYFFIFCVPFMYTQLYSMLTLRNSDAQYFRVIGIRS